MVTNRTYKVFRLLAIVAWAVLSAGCELIGEGDRLIALPYSADTTGRGHVLIEFTGFRCVNCPTAAEEAETLQKLYGEQLIVVAMHPASNPYTQGKYDYTCEAADVYYTYFGGVATTPFPTGNIDFLQNGHSYLNDYSDWPTLLATEMNKPQQVSMQVRAIRNADGMAIQTTFSAASTQECRLAVWLVEDSVRGAQALPDSITTGYIHRHMLRGAIGDPWGKPVTAGPIGETVITSAPLPEDAEQRQYSIVAVLWNADRQIINAKQTTIQ